MNLSCAVLNRGAEWRGVAATQPLRAGQRGLQGRVAHTGHTAPCAALVFFFICHFKLIHIMWLLQVSLATVIFVASQSSLSAEVKTVIKQQLESVANGWTVYRIARQASRMVSFYRSGVCVKPWSRKSKLLVFDLQGCHEFSSELYQCLRTRVASEHFYFWLNSLKDFSQAEQCLTHVEDGDYSGAMSAIAEALRSYQKGIASLTVG